MVATFNNRLTINPSSSEEDKFIKWNQNNHSNVIINVDGSCLGSPTRAVFSGLLRNYVGFYLSGLSGFIQNSADILQAELLAIYHGLLQAKEMAIADLVCYSESLQCINLIKGLPMKFHTYALLIQDIKEFIDQINVTICHTLREGKQCVDVLAKLEAFSNIDFLHSCFTSRRPSKSSKDRPAGIFFLKCSLFFCLFFFFPFVLISIVAKKKL